MPKRLQVKLFFLFIFCYLTPYFPHGLVVSLDYKPLYIVPLKTIIQQDWLPLFTLYMATLRAE